MNKILALFPITLIIASTLFAKDKFRCSYKVSYDIKAVLVLAPGMNTDGVFFLKESPWMDFAKRNNLITRHRQKIY